MPARTPALFRHLPDPGPGGRDPELRPPRFYGNVRNVSRVALLALLCGAGGAVACGGRDYEIDPFPVTVEMDSGVPIAFALTPEVDDIERLTVVDTATPLTILDDGVAGADPTRRVVTFTL